MEITMLDNVEKVKDDRLSIYGYTSSVNPLARGINTSYDRSLDTTPMDDYEVVSGYALENPEDTVKSHSWLGDAWRSFSEKRDDIRLMTERGKLVNEINPKLENIEKELSSTELSDDERSSLEEERDRTLEQRNEVLTSINEIETGIEERKKQKDVSARFKAKEQMAQNAGLTNFDYWKYSVPGTMGSSFSDVRNYIAGAAGLGINIGATALAGTSTVASMGATAPVLVAAAGSLAASAVNLYGIMTSRRSESLAETYGGYKDRVTKELMNKYGKDINSFANDIRSQLYKQMPTEEVDKYTDDQLVDKVLSGEFTIDSKELEDVMKSSKQGLQGIYDRNMALSTMDIAETLLVANPITGSMGKLISTPLKPVFKFGSKVLSPVKKLTEPVTSKYNKILDDIIAWDTKLALQSPGKHAAKTAAKSLGKYGLASVLEGVEEGSQNVFNRDLIAGKYDGESSNWLKAYFGTLDSNYRVAKVLSGIDSESELANDPNFWTEVKAGVALGLLMGGPTSAYNTVSGTAKQLAANRLVRDLTVGNIVKKDLMSKVGAYANKASRSSVFNYDDQIINLLENYKKTKLPDGVTEEDIDKEIELAKSVQRTVKDPNTKNITNKAGYAPGSREYNAYVGLVYNSKADLQEAAENNKQAIQKYESIDNNVVNDAAFEGMNEQAKAVAVALTKANTVIDALEEFVHEVERAPEDGTTKFGIMDKNNPVTKIMLSTAKGVLPGLKEQAKKVAEGTAFSENYSANIDSAQELASAYLEAALSSADLLVSQQNYDVYHGNFNDKNGKKTSFKKLDEVGKTKIANRIKQNVTRYLNTLDNTNQIIEDNAKNIVDSSNTAPTQVTANTETPLNPAAKPTTFDDTIVPPAINKNGNEAGPRPSSQPIPPAGEEYSPATPDENEVNDAVKAAEALTKGKKAKPQPKEGLQLEEGEAPTIDEIPAGEKVIVTDITDLDDSYNHPKEDDKLELDTISEEKLAREKEFDNNSGTNPKDPSRALPLGGLETTDGVSNTLFYNPSSTSQMLPGYKSGSELAKLLEKPGILNECSFRFIINESYQEKDGKKYVKGDKSTYDDAAILLEITHGNDKYLMALKTPKGAAAINSDPEALEKLRSNRNAIIEAYENLAPGQEVVPTVIKTSNGKYNQNTRMVDGMLRPIFRSVNDIPTLGEAKDMEFAIGRGIVGDFDIVDEHGQKRVGRGGSGQLFYIAKPSQTLSGKELPIQMNLKRFNPILSNFITKLVTEYSFSEPYLPGGQDIKRDEVINFLVRFGNNTFIDSDDPRVGWLKDKQFGIDADGKLIVGRNTYDLTKLTDDQIDEIVDAVQNMHWRVWRKTFWGKMRDALPSVAEYFDTTDADIVDLIPGMPFTREDFDNDVTVQEWFVKHNLIECDLKDELFTDAFNYYNGITVINGENQPTITNNTTNTAATASTVGEPSITPDIETETQSKIEDAGSGEDAAVQELLRKIDNGESDPFSLFDQGFPRKKPKEYSGETFTPEEVQWFKNKLGINAENLQFQDQAIALGNDEYAMGLCRLYSTILWKGAERGTLYHEAFHKVSLLLLSPKEREQIYKFYRNKYNFKGTDNEIEEALAEEFRQWMIDNNDADLNMVKKLFKTIKNFIKRWFGRNDNVVTNLFNRINSGYYRDKSKNPESVNRWLERFKEDGGAPFKWRGHEFKSLTNVQLEETIDTLTSFTLLSNNVRVTGDLNALDFDKVKAFLSPTVSQSLVKQGKLTENQAEVRKEIYDNFDNIFKEEIKEKLRKYQIRITEDELNEEIEAKASGDETGDEMAKHTKSSLEISTKSNALTAVKVFVAALPNQQFAEGDNTRLQTVINPATGLPTTVDYDKAWNTLASELAECEEFEDLINSSNEKGKLYPLFKTFANTLVSLTQPIANETEAQKIARENLKTQLRNTFRKNKANLIFVSTQNVTNEDGSVSTNVVVTNENTNRSVKNTIAGWTNELIQHSGVIKMADGKFIVDEDVTTTIEDIAISFAGLTKNLNNLNLIDRKNTLLHLLEVIGIPVDIKTLNAVIDKYYPTATAIESFTKFLNDSSDEGVKHLLTRKIKDLKTISSTGEVKSDKFKHDVTKIFNKNKFANRLAESYNILHPAVNEVSVYTTDDKLYYSITEHNYLSDFTQELNKNEEAVDRLVNVTYVGGNNRDASKHVKGSVVLHKMKHGGKLSVETIVGFRKDGSSDTGRKYTEISPLEDYIMKMTLTRFGKMVLPTMGDSQRYDCLGGTAAATMDYTLNLSRGSIDFNSEALKRFCNYFETELDTIEFNYNNPPTKPEDVIKNYDTGNRNGYKFRYFDGIFTIIDNKVKANSLNEALKEAEALDEANGDKNYTITKSVVAKIRKTWNDLNQEGKRELINNYLKDAFVNELNFAQKLGLITWDGKKFLSVTNVAVPSKFVNDAKTRYSNDPKYSAYADSLATIDVLANYFANSISSVIEFGKIFSKDPAYYKNPVDNIKRYREVLSTGVSPRTSYVENPEMDDLKEFTVGTLADNEITSRQIASIKSSASRSYAFNLLQQRGMTEQQAIDALDNGTAPAEIIDQANAMADARFKGYDDGRINQTDATVLISPEAYKQLVRRIDGWTPEVARAFEVLNDAKILTDRNSKLYHDSLGTILKPLKVMYFGGRWNDELRREIPIFDKMAMFPVFPVFATGDMKYVYDVMTNADKPIHMLAFESAVKVGQDQKTKVYNKDGSVNTEGLSNIVTHTQPLKNFRRQLITDPHDAHDQLFVSQAQKAALLNIRKDNTYTTPDGRTVKGSELLSRVFEALDALTELGAKEIDKDFGVETNQDGELLADNSKVRSNLLNSAKASNMNQNVIEGLEGNSPLSGMSDNAWMESSLISTFNKKMIDVQTEGGMYIQMSSIAYNDLTIRSDGGVRSLKFDNKDGSIECCVSINLLKSIIPEYDKKSFVEAKEWLEQAGLIGSGAKIMAMGYRIPAQGPSSVAALKVVDVYPENVGDTITLPDEWTALTGSDFDIDKLFIARYSYDNNGKKIKFESKEEYTQRLMEEHPDWDDERIVLAVYKRFNDEKLIQGNSKEAWRNELLDMYVAAISNPLQYSESRQPLDAVTSYLTEQILANDIDKARQKNDKPKSQIHYATPAFQNTTKADLIGGKTNLGAFALCNSHHALAQAVDLSFDDNSILRKYGIKSASKIFSDKPNYHDKQPIVTLISDWISAMINAHVDVAKDPYINRLNIRKATINTANLLLRTGKGEATFYFLAQDILIDFANEFDSYSGYYGVELDGQSPKIKAIRHVIGKYQEAYERLSGKQYPINLELDKSIANKIFDINWLRKAMIKPDEDASDTVKANWYKNQLDIMKAFRELEPAARSLSKLTNLSQIDTKKFGNNFALQQNFLMKLATFMRDDKMFVNKGSVIRNTFLRRKLLDGLLRPRKFLNKTMLRLTNTFETYRKDVYYLTGQNEYSSDGYVNAITRMMEASYKVKFISQYADSQGINVAGLLYGDNTIARRLISLKNNIKTGMYPELLNSDGTFSNALLDSIDAMLKISSLDFALPDFLQLNINKSEDQNIDNHIIRAWSELLDSEHKEVREFARDLAVYAMYTSGDAFSKNNIFKYVPESFRESSGYYDSIRKLESNPEELTKYLNKDEIIRSLWWNDDVVPSVSIYRDELDENNVPTRVMIDNIPTDTPLLVDDKLITVPGVLINPSTNYFGINNGSQPIFQPYIKVNLGARNDPRTTMLYKYIGFTMDENEQPVPHYKLVNKLGLNYKGKTLIEPMGGSNPKSMIGANSAYFTFDYRALGINLVTDFRQHTEVFKTDDFTYLESVFGDNAIAIENKKPTVSEPEDDDITKYLAPGEEANEIIRETIELAKKGLKVTNELGEFFTEEEKELIKQATANKNLFVKSASRRTDPVFFTEELINQLKENAKLPFGHPDRFYVIEIWSKHDGLPMSDLIDACIQYRVAPLVSFSISTLGNSAIEPGVMKYNDLLDAIEKLIKAGKLNPATMTIRIDPLLPGVTKLEDIENVVKRASSMGITKFVSSVMQSYGSSERTSRPRGIVPALATAIGYDWDKYYGRDPRGDVEFRPKYEYAEAFGKHLKELIKKYGVKIESCASNNLGLPESACLDPLAIEKVTGVTVDKDLKDPTRKGCMCYGAHGDMLRYSDICKSCCAYCYAAQQNPNMEYRYYDEDGNLIDSVLTRTSRVLSTQKVSNAIPTTKIISGGQTGIDRLGLEIGKELGLETGGTTTPGYYTENGPDTSLQEFGVTEITPELQAGRKGKEFYLPRTEQNVIDSDGTVYFSTNEDSAGLRATQRYAKAHHKPFLLNPTSQELAQWLIDNNITTLNVAGNRGSRMSPEFDSQVRETIRNAFKSSVQQSTQQALEFEQFVEENSHFIDGVLAKQVKKEIAQAEKEPKKLVYTFSDGTEVPTPFELNDQQKQALAEIEAFYNSDETTFTLQGYAGTGKTTIMKIFDVYLKKHYDTPLYIAPTHRANAVTKANNPDVETATLHSFLGLSPQFDITKDEFNLKEIKFDGADVKISDRLLIIDESSMIEDKLYDYIINSAVNGGNKVLFLGDPAQLRPVNSNDISKVFKQESKVELTKVERTGDNAILKEATRLRNGESLSYETDLNGNGEGVIYTKNPADLISFITNIVNSEEYLNNYSYFKILTATNDNIPIYNAFVRTLRFGKNAPQLVKGELLMGYNNEIRTRNKRQPYALTNSVDYVVTKDPVKTTKKVTHTDIVLEGYNVTLKNVIGNEPEFEAFIADNNTPNKVLRSISLIIDELWKTYRELKSMNRIREAAAIIQQINEIQNSFCTMKPIVDELSGAVKRGKSLDYGYAHTIHKSQGGTYNKVLVLGGSIDKFQDPQEQQQLSYVAITRAKEQVMWTVPEKSNITITTKQQPTAPLNPEIQELANAGVKRQNECK